MKVAFVIQGEGRGHLTQALSMLALLAQGKHELVAVIIGKSELRKLPDFFLAKIPLIPLYISSPNFIKDKENKGIDWFKTVFKNLFWAPKHLKSLKSIHHTLSKVQPEVVFNFYEPMYGLYTGFYSHSWKSVSIGHQYWVKHPDFPVFKEHAHEQKMLRFLNHISARGSMKRWALSLVNAASIPDTLVCPPLLRSEVYAFVPEKQSHILVYMVNAGYCKDVEKWHEGYRTIVLDVFSDRQDVEDAYQPHPNLRFWKLNDALFLEKMRTCYGFVSSAGFESVCEAALLGKPMVLIPTEGQFEQTLNALDAEALGISRTAQSYLQMHKYLDFFESFQPVDKVQEWIRSGPKVLGEMIGDLDDSKG